MDLLLDALAVLLPVDCAGCGAPDRAACAACRLLLLDPPVETVLDGLVVRSAAAYEGAVRSLVLAFKEEGRTDLAGALASPLRRLVPAGVDLVTIPPSAAGLRRRGYDPVAVLARRLPARRARVLRVARSGEAQKRLDVVGREGNRAGSMTVTATLTGRRLLLLDDVVTTGATLREAARALRGAGAEVVGAVTIAATPRYSLRDR